MMSALYRYDTDDEAAVVEYADVIDDFTEAEWDELRALFCTIARVPFRFEVTFQMSVNHIVEGRPVVRVIDEYSSGGFFVCFLDDCYDPPMYLVRGDSWDDAYDNFMVDPKIESFIMLDDLTDLDPDSVTYNDNGTAVDSDAVMVFGPLTAAQIRLRGA